MQGQKLQNNIGIAWANGWIAVGTRFFPARAM